MKPKIPKKNKDILGCFSGFIPTNKIPQWEIEFDKEIEIKAIFFSEVARAFKKNPQDIIRLKKYINGLLDTQISSLKTRLLEELPKEIGDFFCYKFDDETILGKPAIEGYNYCLSQVRQIINKVFEE